MSDSSSSFSFGRAVLTAGATLAGTYASLAAARWAY